MHDKHNNNLVWLNVFAYNHHAHYHVVMYHVCCNILLQEYKVTEERKEDQNHVDKQVCDAIRKHEDGRLLVGYLGAMFSLKNGQYPHKMKF